MLQITEARTKKICSACDKIINGAVVTVPTILDYDDTDWETGQPVRASQVTLSHFHQGCAKEKTAKGEPTQQDIDYEFGVCPSCLKTDGYIDIGRDHWFFCSKHKVRWYVGSNLFSSAKLDTARQKRAMYKRLRMDSFRILDTPFYGKDHLTKRMTDMKQKWFGLEYQLQEDPKPRKWRGRAQSTGEFPWQAIANFASDYSPSMGTLIAIRLVEKPETRNSGTGTAKEFDTPAAPATPRKG